MLGAQALKALKRGGVLVWHCVARRKEGFAAHNELVLLELLQTKVEGHVMQLL